MARTPKDVTDAELAILEVLWERGRSTVRDLTHTLYKGNDASQTATVQKLCERLQKKGYIDRSSKERPATYGATADRTDLIGRQLKGVADKLCAGSLTPLLTQLVEIAGLDKSQLQQLREQVDRLDGANQRQPKEKKERGDLG